MGRNYERLESARKCKLNQYQMLNNTLVDLLTNNADVMLTKRIKDEIDATLAEIKQINSEMNQCANEDEEVNYCSYDERYKESNEQEKNSLFDLIEKKHSKTFNESVKVSSKDVNFNDEYIDKINESADSRILNNRFLLKFGNGVKIPEIMVKSIYFGGQNENILHIRIYDFVDENGEPLMKILKNMPNEFNITIEHLKTNGDIMYFEKYYGCKILSFYRDALDYSNDDFSMVEMQVAYKNVEFE